jgi:cysteinyl-tRNA synthetase
MERLQIALQNADRYLALPDGGADTEAAAELARQAEAHRARFTEAMDDDFNTPAALAVLFGLATEMNRVTASAAAQSAEGASAVQAARAAFDELTNVLGLTLTPERAAAENDSTAPVMELILEARQALRRAKDYAAADELRSRLGGLNIVVEDRPGGGSTWRRESG